MKYRPEIDGLRAMAVLPVVFFHAEIAPFSGGFVGVDVFFVISGYLITSILLKEIEHGDFSLVRFYERRARRILPALALVILTCIPFAIFLLTPVQLKDFAQSVLSVGLFVSNIQFWRKSGYFEAASEENPLLHTWSLAIEEQYYILFPLFLLLIVTRRRQLLVPIMIMLALSSLALSEWGWRNAPSGNFFLLPSRAWELIAGSLCAVAARRNAMEKEWLAAPGLLMIATSVFVFSEQTPFPSLYALLPVVGTVLVILFAGPQTITGRILATPSLVGIGLVSYSAYLWHQPLFAFARIEALGDLPRSTTYGLIILTFVLAYLSWRYVETPFRRTRTRTSFSRKTIFALSGVTTVVFVAFGALGHVTDGWRTTYMARLSEPKQRLFLQMEQVSQTHHANAVSRYDNGACTFDTSVMDEPTADRIVACADAYGPGVMILGDSHAIDLFGAVTETSRNTYPFIVGVVSGGCRPHTPSADCAYSDVVDFLSSHSDAFKIVVYEQAGFYLLQGQGYDTGTRRMFSKLPLSAETPLYIPNEAYISSVTSYLRVLAEYVPVVWLSPRVEPHISSETILHAGCDYDFQLRPDQETVFRNLEAAISQSLADLPVMFMSQIELLNLSFPGDFLNCETLFWTDGDHFSDAGERRFGQRMQILNNAFRALGIEEDTANLPRDN